MNLIAVGTNHKYSPVEIREKLSFLKKGLKKALVSLAGFAGIKATVILSTCNRVELYASTQDTDTGIKTLKAFLSAHHHQSSLRIEPYLYTYIGKEAIRHLFRVSAGLDSQIIGESQILEQVRFAFGEARTVEATDRLLDTIFAHAMRASLRVRKESGIAKGQVSIASIIAGLIKRRYGCIKNKRILIIGVGKIAELITRYIKEEGAKTVFIANRTYAKAWQLARCMGAEVVRFDRLKEKLLDTDIIISATASPHFILKKEDLRDINNPLLIIDLAVPRDVDPQVKYMEGISLFCLDDLDFIIENNLQSRRQSMPQALEIINKEVENLCSSGRLELEPEAAPLP